MIERMLSYIKEQKLFDKRDKVLLAVSGGVDSVVMTELISLAEFDYAIAHCNFKLRGKDADDDEKFVKNLAKRKKVKFFSISFDTEKYAEENKLSIQMAARELRYDWLEKIRKENSFDFICTAHHLNDSIETVLINLTKGTGISGLTGIKPKNKKIVRPVLFATRHEIEKDADKNKIKYRTDVSNLSDDYVRNKIRLNVIPVLKEINPSLENTFLNNMLHLQDIEEMSGKYFNIIKNKIFKQNGKEFIINTNELKKLNSSGTILYYILRDFNFLPPVSSQVFHSLNAQSGKKFYSQTHELIKHGSNFILKETEDKKTVGGIIINKSRKRILFNDLQINIFKLNLKNKKDKNKLNLILKDADFAAIDGAKLFFPLILRSWKPGDYFIPFGMKGKRKKLSDYFVDKKISVDEKRKIKVITSGGEIAWVVGKRVDERFAVTPGTTNVLLMQLLNKNDA